VAVASGTVAGVVVVALMAGGVIATMSWVVVTVASAVMPTVVAHAFLNNATACARGETFLQPLDAETLLRPACRVHVVGLQKW
jgi:hypothetical protein